MWRFWIALTIVVALIVGSGVMWRTLWAPKYQYLRKVGRTICLLSVLIGGILLIPIGINAHYHEEYGVSWSEFKWMQQAHAGSDEAMAILKRVHKHTQKRIREQNERNARKSKR
jgi:hypothetical protein